MLGQLDKIHLERPVAPVFFLRLQPIAAMFLMNKTLGTHIPWTQALGSPRAVPRPPPEPRDSSLESSLDVHDDRKTPRGARRREVAARGAIGFVEDLMRFFTCAFRSPKPVGRETAKDKHTLLELQDLVGLSVDDGFAMFWKRV